MKELDTSQNICSKISDMDININHFAKKDIKSPLKRKLIKIGCDRPMTLDELERDPDSDKENDN
jgi:hypothetical protein